MHLEQVNSLLMEKVTMQTDGLGQREKMLEREREFSGLKMVLAGKDIPEEAKGRLMNLAAENEGLKDQLKTANEKLTKAKQVCSFIVMG